MENVSSRTSSKNIKHLSKSSWSDIYNLSLKSRSSKTSLADHDPEFDNNNAELLEKLNETENAYQKVMKDYEELKIDYNNVKNDMNNASNPQNEKALQNQISLLQSKCSKYENDLLVNKNLNKELSDHLKLSQKDLENQKDEFKHQVDNYEKRIKNFEIIINKYREDKDTNQLNENDIDKKSKEYYDKIINEKNEQLSSFRQKCRELEDRVSKQNETLFKKNNELNDCKRELEQFRDIEKKMKEDINSLKSKVSDLKQENIQLRYETYEKDSTIGTLQEHITVNEKDLKKVQSELLITKNDLKSQLNIKEDFEKKYKSQSFSLEKEKDKNMNLLNQIETQKNHINSLEDKISILIIDKEKQNIELEEKSHKRAISENNPFREKVIENDYKEKYLSSQHTINDLQKEIEKLNKELTEEQNKSKEIFMSALSNRDNEKGKRADDQLSVKSASYIHSVSSNNYRFSKPLPNINKKENDLSKIDKNDSFEYTDTMDKTSKLFENYLEMENEFIPLDIRSIKSSNSVNKDGKPSGTGKKELSETELKIERLNVQINKKRYELELLQRYIESLLYKIREKDEIIYDFESSQEEIGRAMEKEKELNKDYQTMIHQIESSRIEIMELNKELNQKIASLNDDLKSKEDECDSLLKKLSSLEKLNESIAEKSEEKDKELSKLKGEFETKDREYQTIYENLDDMKKVKANEIKNLKDIISDLRVQLETSKNYYNSEKMELNQSIEKLKSDNEDLQLVCHEKELLGKTLEQLKDNLVEKEKQNQDMKRSLDDLNDVLYKTRTENDSLKNSLADLKTTLDRKDNEISNIKDSFKLLSESVSKKEDENEKLNSDLRSLDNTIIQNKTERDEMANTINELTNELAKGNEEKNRLQSKINDMKELLNKKEEEYDLILHLLQELKTNFSNKENENAQMKNSIQKLQLSVTEKEKENSQMKDSIEKLQNSVSEKEKENTQMKNSLQQLKHTISEKDNENSEIKNSLQQLQHSMSEKENEYSQIKNSLQILKNSMTEKDKEVQDTVDILRNQLSQKEKEYQNLVNDLNRSKETISKLNEAQEKSFSELQEFRDQNNKYNSMKKEKDDLIKELDFYTETMQKYNTRCKQLEAMNKEYFDHINKLKEENTNLKKQEAEDQAMIKQTLSDVQKEIENANQQIRNYREKENSLLMELNEEKKLCENLKKTKNEMEEVFKRMNTDTSLEDLISSLKENNNLYKNINKISVLDPTKPEIPTRETNLTTDMDNKEKSNNNGQATASSSSSKISENSDKDVVDRDNDVNKDNTITDNRSKFNRVQYLTFKKKVKDISLILEQKYKELSNLHQMVCNNMKEFCDKNFIKDLDYTTSDNNVQHITVEKYLNLPVDTSKTSSTNSLLNDEKDKNNKNDDKNEKNNENNNENDDEEVKIMPNTFPSFKNNIFSSNLSRILKSNSLKERNNNKNDNQSDPYLTLAKKKVAEEYMMVIDALRENLLTLRFFLNYLKDDHNTSVPTLNQSQTIISLPDESISNQERLAKEFMVSEDNEKGIKNLMENIAEGKPLNEMESESNEDVDLLKRRLYFEIKNRWNIEEKLKSQYNLFVTFQKMLDCSIKQITENQSIIEELYTRLREANTKIKELEEENTKLKNKCQALEKKWYKQNIFNESFNGKIDKRKMYSLSPISSINAPDRGFEGKNPFNSKDTSASIATINPADLQKESSNFDNSDIEDNGDNVILYKTNEFPVDLEDSDNDIESDESNNLKHLPSSFILNDEIFEKISHIQKEEDNYEKQIEDLIQKTVQYKLEIFENNYSYKN